MEAREQDEGRRARKRHGYEGSVETNQRIAQGAVKIKPWGASRRRWPANGGCMRPWRDARMRTKTAARDEKGEAATFDVLISKSEHPKPSLFARLRSSFTAGRNAGAKDLRLARLSANWLGFIFKTCTPNYNNYH